MAGFFTAEVLNGRVIILRDERVPNPDLYPALKAIGFDNLPDQSGMAAFTFSDVSH
jgi:hypothetical protein